MVERITTIRLNNADEKALGELRKKTGIVSVTELIRYAVRVAAGLVPPLLLLLAACGSAVDSRGTLEGCTPEPTAVQAWCDRAHPLAEYCSASPQPDYCVVVKVADDGTGDALYCCDPTGLRE